MTDALIDIDDIFPEGSQMHREIWAPFDNDPQKIAKDGCMVSSTQQGIR